MLAALVAHQLLTGAEDQALELLLLAVALTNLAVLLVSYRNALRREKRGSGPDRDAQGTTGAW